jgi:nucleotide-binding universal stress UspA family protein
VPAAGTYPRVLCATDLSPTGDAAVSLAYRLVAPEGRMHLLHVYDPAWDLRDVAFEPGSPPPCVSELVAASERAAREHLGRLAAGAGRPDVATEEILLHHLNAATAVAEQTRRVRADVVVLGTHGRAGLGRLLLGSVATDVLRRANVPVVLFHDPAVRDR